MRTLVIHLGLPKTATTTLQTTVFPRFTGYLGIKCQARTARDAATELFSIYRSFTADGRGGNDDIKTQLCIWAQRNLNGDMPTLLLSEEKLAEWPWPPGSIFRFPTHGENLSQLRRGTHPIAHFLSILKEVIGGEFQISTILTLRNQVEWLGSLAAETRCRKASFFQRLTKGYDKFLDYHDLVLALEGVVGAQNHLTLLFEDGLNENIIRIQSFLGDDAFAFQESNWILPTIRQSRRDESTWIGPGPVPTLIGSAMHRLTQLKRFTCLQAFRPIGRGFVVWTSRLFSKLENEIHFTADDRVAIQARYRESNLRLAQHMDRDLTAKGYL